MFSEKEQVSVLRIANMDHRTTERSTSDSFGDISQIQEATLQLYRRNVPLLRTSRYVTACDSLLPGLSLHQLQGTNTGERRPGYEGRDYLDSQARHSQSAQGEKERLVTLDRFCRQCWQYQSTFNNCIYLPYWSHNLFQQQERICKLHVTGSCK